MDKDSSLGYWEITCLLQPYHGIAAPANAGGQRIAPHQYASALPGRSAAPADQRLLRRVPGYRKYLSQAAQRILLEKIQPHQ